MSEPDVVCGPRPPLPTHLTQLLNILFKTKTPSDSYGYLQIHKLKLSP